MWGEKPLGLKYAKGYGLRFLFEHTSEGFRKVLFNPMFQVNFWDEIIGPMHTIVHNGMFISSSQYLHPHEAESYRETIRALRTIGKECILKRIKALSSNESVELDILTCILQIASIC